MKLTDVPRKGIIPATLWVQMDELAYYLIESDFQSPGSRGWRRYQRIWVIRNDALAEFKKDLGASENCTIPPFGIPGGVIDEFTGKFDLVHTVGELVDIADKIRSGKCAEPDFGEPDDLVNQYYDEIDQRWKWRKRQTTLGPGGWIQRG